MAYGPPKFSTSQVIDSTLAAIRQELEKNSDLSSGNLAFYGFEVEFDIKLKLTARGNSDQEVRGKVEVGEVRPLQEPGTSPEEGETTETVPVQVQSNVRRGRQRVQNPAPVNK